jgi:hypothetical protein
LRISLNELSTARTLSPGLLFLFGDVAEIEFDQFRVVAVGTFLGPLQDFGAEVSGEATPVLGGHGLELGFHFAEVEPGAGAVAVAVRPRLSRLTGLALLTLSLLTLALLTLSLLSLLSVLALLALLSLLPLLSLSLLAGIEAHLSGGVSQGLRGLPQLLGGLSEG